MDIYSWIGLFGLLISVCIFWCSIRRIRGWNRDCRAVDAMQRGDITTLTEAPLPRSLYDFYIDRITQDFILSNYEKIRKRWLIYRGGIGEAQAAEKIAGLEDMNRRAELLGDIAKENLRRAEFRQQRKDLGKERPAPSTASPEEDRGQERLWEEELARHERMVAVFDRHNLPPDHEARGHEEHTHDDRQRRIIEGRPLLPL